MVMITDEYNLALGTDIGARQRRNSGVGILGFQAIVIATDQCIIIDDSINNVEFKQFIITQC